MASRQSAARGTLPCRGQTQFQYRGTAFAELLFGYAFLGFPAGKEVLEVPRPFLIYKRPLLLPREVHIVLTGGICTERIQEDTPLADMGAVRSGGRSAEGESFAHWVCYCFFFVFIGLGWLASNRQNSDKAASI